MKKILSLFLGTALAVGSVSAQSDDKSIVLTFKDGTVLDYRVADVEHITFRTHSGDDPVKEVPIKIDVKQVGVNAVRATLKADDPSMTFLFGLMKKSEYDSYANEKAFLDGELGRLTSEAASMADDLWLDGTLASYLDFLLGYWEPDNQVLNRDNLLPDTEYVIYAYGIDTKGKFTTGVAAQTVRTNPMLNIDFNLKATDITSTTATLTASPDNVDTYYYIGYIAKSEFENGFGGDKTAVLNNALASVKMAVGNEPSQLSQVATVRKGDGSLSLEGLTPGMEFYALAFAIDQSVAACSELTMVPFATAPVTVTDDCSFAISAADVTPMLINLTVSPSKNTTRYFVTIRSKADVAALTPSQVADSEVAFQNSFTPPIDWSTDPRVFTGTQTLNSRKNLGITIVRPATNYTVYVFGVSDKGVRTTEVATFDVATPEAAVSSMTLSIKDIVADGEVDPNDWFGNKMCYFSYTVSPSVDTEYYYTGVVKKSDYAAFPSDEAFMADVIAKAGDLIMMNCYMGENNGALTSTPSPFKTTSDYRGLTINNGEEYYVFAFGYAGKATTPLFKEITTATDGSGTGGGGGWGDWGY